MKAPLAATLLLATLGIAGTVHAQTAAPEGEKVKQVIVYGDDPCPASGGDEITVCARLPDADRYRIPKELRGDALDPRTQSWAARATQLEYVGRSGTDSCSPSGAGGFTGCLQQMTRLAREERRSMMGNVSWSKLVEQERTRRLSTIDSDSQRIEDRVKAEEAAEAARANGAATAPVAGSGD